MDMDRRFAVMFIERMRLQTEYMFFLTNREGIIIAATDRESVGVFHEASFVMMRDNLDMIIVRPEETSLYLGVKPGIDVPIVHNGETVGALGITGIPEEVKPIITAIKMTIEAVLEYEMLKERATKKDNEQESFYNILLNNKLARSEQLETLARRLGYDSDIMRIAIVLTVDSNEAKALQIVREEGTFSKQDIAFVNREDEIVIFRCLPEKPDLLFKTFRQSIWDYLKNINALLNQQGISCIYYIGSMQVNLNNYHFAYRHCCWMIDTQRTYAFFYDFTDDYVKSQVPMTELSGIFQPILTLFDETMSENFLETVSLLERNNYNLASSSKEVYLHKNTLVFRLNKIRDFLNTNPIQSAGDRVFMGYLCHYMNAQDKGLFR